MFERVCVLLLRLYPAGFRRAYERDALQFLRDRARDERGFILRARLLIDLTSDLFATWIRGWQPAEPLIARTEGGPHFDIIEVHGPSPVAMTAGLLTSMLLFASFSLLFRPEAPPNVAALLGDGSGSDVAGASGSDDKQQKVVDDVEARHKLVAAIAENLKLHYVDSAVGLQLADALLAHDKLGEYAAMSSESELAARINKDLFASAQSLGIPRGAFVANVLYSARVLPSGPPPMPMTPEMRKEMGGPTLAQNCYYRTIEMLPRGIGYLKLNGFADQIVCREWTDKAMATLNAADALIIDLRENGGGYGETALQIAGYLFDHPAFMFDPRAGTIVPPKTASPVPGNKLADKPVYILTSSTTQSAAEYFVYNMKMLKRATIVGETTAGQEHSGAFFRVNDHWGMGIQDAPLPDNPYPVKGWETIGVEPDVRVAAPAALDEAKKRLSSR